MNAHQIAAYNDWGLIGHEWAVAMFRQHIQHQRLRHAYLIHGIEGIGKQALARTFAQALLCETPAQPGAPCHHCRACNLIAKRQHPDIHELHPVVGGNIIKTRSIKIDSIRELNYQVVLRPVEAARRIALLFDFEAANDAAANALLKTLEEPPPDVLFVLTVNNLDAVLPTILSRCELYGLRPLPIEQTQQALQQHWAASPTQAELLAHLSTGRLGWAIDVLHDPAILERRQHYLTELQRLLAAGLVERFAFAEKAAQDSEQLTEMFAHWLSWWRDALLLAHQARTVRLTNVDQRDALQQVAAHCPTAQIQQVLHAIQDAMSQQERNLNPRLLCEVLLLALPTLTLTAA